jgi:hypothetical protein
MAFFFELNSAHAQSSPLIDKAPLRPDRPPATQSGHSFERSLTVFSEIRDARRLNADLPRRRRSLRDVIFNATLWDSGRQAHHADLSGSHNFPLDLAIVERRIALRRRLRAMCGDENRLALRPPPNVDAGPH